VATLVFMYEKNTFDVFEWFFAKMGAAAIRQFGRRKG
jgi:hypothetical protein